MSVVNVLAHGRRESDGARHVQLLIFPASSSTKFSISWQPQSNISTSLLHFIDIACRCLSPPWTYWIDRILITQSIIIRDCIKKPCPFYFVVDLGTSSSLTRRPFPNVASTSHDIIFEKKKNKKKKMQHELQSYGWPGRKVVWDTSRRLAF